MPQNPFPDLLSPPLLDPIDLIPPRERGDIQGEIPSLGLSAPITATGKDYAQKQAAEAARENLDNVTWNLRHYDQDNETFRIESGEYAPATPFGIGYGDIQGFEVTRNWEKGTESDYLTTMRNQAKARILASNPDANLDESFDAAYDDRFRNVVLANKYLEAGEGSSKIFHYLVGTMTPQQRKGFIHEVYKEQKSRQPLKRSKLGRVTQRVQRGFESLPEAFNYIKDSWGPWSDAERSEFRRDVIQLEEIRRGFDPATSDNMFMQGLLGAAEMAGPMLTGGMVAGKAGKAAAALGAGTKGVAFAAATGGTTFWTGLEGSHIHRAMIDEGVSKSSADMWALVGGAAIGSLEYLQYKLLLPGSMRGKLGEGIARSIPHSAIRAGARYEGEITVEMLQSVTGTVAEQVAQRLEGINTFDSKRELEEFKDEFREVALAMIFMTGPASVIEGVQDHMSRKTIAQIELYAEEMRAAEEKRVQDFAEANQDARDREDEKEEQFLLDRALAEQERGIAEREARAKDAAKEPSRQEYRDTIQRAADWEAMDVFTQREDETEGDLQKRVVSDILFETAVDADLEGQLNEFIKNPSRSKASAVILPDGTRLGSKLGGLGSREAFVREIQRQQGRAEVDRGPSELNIGDVVDIGEDDAAGRPEATGTVIAQRPGGNYDVELPSGEQLTVNAQQDVTFVHPSREQEVAPPQPVPQAEPSPVPTLEEMSRTELLDYAVDRAGMDSQYVARRLGFLSEPAIRRKISEVMEAPVAPPRVEGEGVPDIGREPPQEPTEAPVAPEPEVQPPAPPVTLEQVDRMTGKNLHNLITELGIKGVKGKKKAVLRKAIIDHLGLKAVAEAAEPVAPVVEAAREEVVQPPPVEAVARGVNDEYGDVLGAYVRAKRLKESGELDFESEPGIGAWEEAAMDAGFELTDDESSDLYKAAHSASLRSSMESAGIDVDALAAQGRPPLVAPTLSRDAKEVWDEIQEEGEACPDGLCYRNTNKTASEMDVRGVRDVNVVHGKVMIKGKMSDHAWIEVGDTVYDPTLHWKTSKKEYYDTFKAQPDSRYMAGQAVQHQARTNKQGPWTAEEVGDLQLPVEAVAEAEEAPKRMATEGELKRVVTAFAGVGTVESALEGVRGVAAYDFDADVVAEHNLVHGSDYVPRNINTVTVEEIVAADAEHFHASPVCKNCSAAKRGATIEDQDLKNGEFIARVILGADIPVITIENIPGYIGTIPYNTIIKALEEAGYTWDVVNHDAADYGAAQTRKRIIIRAVKNGPLPPLPEKQAPGDWYEAIKDLIDEAPDFPFRGKSAGMKSDELQRIENEVEAGNLDRSKPILTMGGSASKGKPYAANAGNPAPTLLSSDAAVPRILMPDGRVKRMTPRMMARLMGLPDSYQVPATWKMSKIVLGNGVHAEVTRQLIQPLLDRVEEAPAPPAAAEIIGEAEEKPTEKPDKPDVAMEAMPDQEQAEKDLERRETRRKYRRTDEEAVKNAKKLAKEWVDEGGLEKEMRDELDVLEDDNPGIEDAMEGAIFDKENNRLISLDGLTGVVWENDGNVRGSFHVEHYGFNEKSATGQSTMDLFMRRAAQMSEADYEKDIRAGRKDDLPSHRTILEALIATGKGDQVTDVAAEGHKDLKRPPTQASVLPVVMFDLGPVTGAIKRGLDWAKETVKAFWKKYLSSAGLIGKMGKAAYDRMIATVAADLNEARNRYDDFLRAVRKANDGTPLHKLSPAKKLELFEALSDPVLRTTLDADVAAAVEAIREHIAIMSQRLIDADILTEEMELVFDENMQAYLHRSYQGADDPNWAKKVRKQPKVIARAKVVIQDRHRRRRRKKVTKKIKDDIKRRARDGEGSKLTTLEESQVDQELVDAVAEQQKWKPTKAERDAAIEKEVAENEEIKEAVAKGKIKTEAGKRRRAAKIVDNQIKQHRKARVRDTLSQGLDSVMVDQIVEENTTDLTDKELETEVEVLIRRIEKIGEGERGDATVRANHGILKHRKDIDEAIRSLYGEYKDVGTAYVKSINKMSNMLAKHEFLSALRVALPDDMLSETKTPETPEQLKGEEWGDINGWWVSRSFLAAEKDLFGKGGELPTWAKIWFNGVGHAKAAKTVMSMVTTIRNFVSNVSFAVINGHTGHKNWRQAMKYGWLHMQPDLASGKFDRTGPTHEMAREFVNKMVKLGVLGQSQAREMTSLIKEAWDAEFDAYVFGREEQAEELAGKVLRKLRQRGGKVYKGLGTIYQAMDEIPKMVGFISNREMLKEAFPDWTDAQLDEEAARRVSNQYPTWNKIPLGIRKLRVWPFQGTFVSFASELIRTTTMTMKQAKEDMNSGNARLKRHGQLVGVRMLGMSFGLKAAINSLVALNIFGGFDDDDRDALDRHVAPWSRHSTKIMWRNSEGGIEHFDISFMFPHLALLDAFNAFDDEDVPLFRRAWDAMGELGGDAILGEDMVVQKVREAFSNSKREGGTIWYKSDTFAEKAWKFSNHLLDPWKPGTYTSGRRFIRGLTGYTEQSGRSYSAPYEMLAMFTGARHSTVDLKQSMRFKAVRFKANLRDAKARISREAYSQRTGSDVAMKSKLAQSDAAIKGYYHDMYLDVQAAMKLGMNRRQVSGILRDNGFSEKDVKLIMRDRHAVQTWSDEQLRKIGKTTGGRNKRVSLRGRRRDSR